MIIKNYILKEAFKSQIAILFILLVIFFCQKLLRILSATSDGDTPAQLILTLLYLGIPEMLKLILPLSLFLGILMSYGRLYMDSEVISMHAGGVSKNHLRYPVLVLSIVTAAFSAYNVNWLSPNSSLYQDKVIAEAKANPSLAGIIEGQFQRTNNDGNVLYIGDINKNSIGHIFIAQLAPGNDQLPSITVADKGSITRDKQGNQHIQLYDGTRYEGFQSQHDFRITQFKQYYAQLDYKPVQLENDINDVEDLSFSSLLKSDNRQAPYELSWRLTLILSIPLLAFIALPLSVTNPRQSRVVSMLPAILIYLIFFLLQNSLKSNGMSGKVNSLSLIWVVNFVYLILGIVLNSWDSSPLRRLKARLKGNA